MERLGGPNQHTAQEQLRALQAERAAQERALRLTSTARKVRLYVGIPAAIITGIVGVSKYARTHHKLGDSVLSADECASRKMVQGANGRLVLGGICTEDCSGDQTCGASFQCYDGHCVPQGSRAFGEDCDVPWECSSRVCVTQSTPANYFTQTPTLPKVVASYCSKLCSDASPCREGYLCESLDGKPTCVKELSADLPAALDVLRQLQNLPPAQ